MVSDFVRRLQSSAADLKSIARGFWLHIGELVLGTFCLIALAPEALSVWEHLDSELRDANGELGTFSQVALVTTTLVSCGVTLVIFHLLFHIVTRLVKSRWLSTVALIIVVAVILAPQYLNVVRGLPMGNSLDTSPGDIAALKTQLMSYGGGIRLIVILLGTIVASIGLTLMHRGFRNAVKASRAGQDARVMQEAIMLIDDGYKEASDMRNFAAEVNRDLATQFARGVTEGMEDHARTITRYLSGRPSGFPNAEQWLQDLQDQFKRPFTVSDESIAECVELRLQQHRIEIGLLPNSPEMLSPTARAALADHANWLREQANFDAIVSAIALNTEPAYA